MTGHRLCLCLQGLPKVKIHAGERKGADSDEDLEWAYNQGMYKAELCNK